VYRLGFCRGCQDWFRKLPKIWSSIRFSPLVAAWLSSNSIAHTLHRARLVLGWVTKSEFNSQCGTFISVCDQPPRSTQPGHPFVGSQSTSQRAVTPSGWE